MSRNVIYAPQLRNPFEITSCYSSVLYKLKHRYKDICGYWSKYEANIEPVATAEKNTGEQHK